MSRKLKKYSAALPIVTIIKPECQRPKKHKRNPNDEAAGLYIALAVVKTPPLLMQQPNWSSLLNFSMRTNSRRFLSLLHRFSLSKQAG